LFLRHSDGNAIRTRIWRTWGLAAARRWHPCTNETVGNLVRWCKCQHRAVVWTTPVLPPARSVRLRSIRHLRQFEALRASQTYSCSACTSFGTQSLFGERRTRTTCPELYSRSAANTLLHLCSANSKGSARVSSQVVRRHCCHYFGPKDGRNFVHVLSKSVCDSRLLITHYKCAENLRHDLPSIFLVLLRSCM
jgi:hypothetical protein